jgi:hypothetical protein
MPALIDLAGERFGRLTVLSRIPRERQRGTHTQWNCRCDCGATTTAQAGNLRSGNTTSCGCYHRELMRDLSPAARVRRGVLTRWTNRKGITSCVQPDGTVRRFEGSERELKPRRRSVETT